MPGYALLSVSDKTSIVDLARGLVDLGYTILSTGGTARVLAEAGVAVQMVSDHTGHPEIMNGRVKTLHPKIHGGILGRRGTHDDEANANGIGWIDVVACNLYPFERTISAGSAVASEVIEQIDIGGPSMVRSAAKNHSDVVVLTDPADYGEAIARLADGTMTLDARRSLAWKAFRHTANYDGIIAGWFGRELGQLQPDETAIPVRAMERLRYGENPHQTATFYAEPGLGGRSLARVKQIQGKALSFNNLADLDATLRAVFHFDDPACVVTKHMNPCGAAVHVDGPERAFLLALSADPVSAYGGIVCFNRPVDAETARSLRKSRTFFEVIAAPGFSDEARSILAPREKIRVMELPEDWANCRPGGTDARRVQGGWLLQDWDLGAPINWTVPSGRTPTEPEEGALRFAWGIVQHVKSNAIVVARAEDGGFVLNGVGAGQMSRVDSVRIALSKATRPVEGSVLASDAFFPFADGVEEALAAGIRAVIQPGGSIRDESVVAAVDASNATMVFTGARHFRH
ncbi:MAG: bifunctional phosphoribosylaminoimidazolecarboxamide formyltransferase/IMP cyclohydrolase [Myxococcota bacterium]|nr:bifunctional phosphoribosylaminoimidazolecarboxamide formyltransferase/IMP cyclohydrolase [Myxococcota bacterium]